MPLSLHTPFVLAPSWSFYWATALFPSGGMEPEAKLNRTGELLLAQNKISFQVASEGLA